MSRYNMYELTPGDPLDSFRTALKRVTPPPDGPNTAPDGNYWIAYEPDYKNGTNIFGDALTRLRPALLQSDSIHLDDGLNMIFVSPTEYAKRWGLHEDAPIGRSRTSLTRSDTRVFQKAGSQQAVTGKWLAEYFKKKSSQENMDISGWLEQVLPRIALSEDDRTYLEWLDDLLKDEVWQGMLFNDFTMDELHEDDVFTMRDDIARCDIRGSMHPLIVRENWIAPAADSGFGLKKEEPRWFYEVGDQEGEYDPVNNDKLWDAMRPALLLVSRILKEKPEFLNAILRVWDYKNVPLWRDTRPDKPFPLKTFDTVPCSANDPAVFPEVQFLRPMGEKYVATLWRVLARRLRFHIHGNMPECGITTMSIDEVNDRHKSPNIYIVINAEMIFPLLIPGYSQSEKIMASFYLAATLLHELAHAFFMMAKTALFRPDSLPSTVAPKRDYWKFYDAARNFVGGTNSEPYFRSEPVSELGFSFENWLFGGAASPLTHGNHRSKASGLSWQSVALRSERFPFYRCLDSSEEDKNQIRYGGAILNFPVYDTEELYTNCAVNAVAPYFQQRFWMNPVKVYGLKALKMHAASHKMKAAMALFENKSSHSNAFYVDLQDSRDRIEGLVKTLKMRGFPVAANYLNALIVERVRLQIGIMRWEMQVSCFTTRGERASRNLWKAHTIALETQIYNVFLQLQAKNTPEHKMQAFVVESYRRWERYVSYLPDAKPPNGSEALAWNGAYGFILGLEGVVKQSGCRRYLTCLPDVSAYLSEELQHLENAIFEVYMMDNGDMQHMLSRFRRPWFNNLDHLTKIVRGFVLHMSIYQGQHEDIGTWMTNFLEMAHQYTILKQYLTSDQKKLNPVTWRHMFLSIGRGNAARKTPSKNWANLVREQVCKMPANLRVEFESVVNLVVASSGTQAPHTLAKTLSEQYSRPTAPSGASNPFMDFLNDLEASHQLFAAEALAKLSQDPSFNPDDGQTLKDILDQARVHVGRRHETRREIQQLQAQLNGLRYALRNDDTVYQAQQASLHAQQRRAELERQISGLEQLQLQHHQLHNYQEIHAELNVLQDMLGELRDEANLRELYAQKILEDLDVAEKQAWEQRLLEAEIENLREAERRHEEKAIARIAEEHKKRNALKDPNPLGWASMFRARYPPTLEEDMLPLDLTKRKRLGDDGPRAKRPRFRTEALKTLINKPPFIGGPVRIAERPLPFTRSEQLEMPHGGLPEVRYPIKPLAVRGNAAINVVERMADAVERWGEVGVKSRYELPKGAVEALAAVADSEDSGLPRKP